MRCDMCGSKNFVEDFMGDTLCHVCKFRVCMSREGMKERLDNNTHCQLCKEEKQSVTMLIFDNKEYMLCEDCGDKAEKLKDSKTRNKIDVSFILKLMVLMGREKL